MEPYYEHSGVTIYNGDCLDVMAGMEPASVDLIVADPPYYKVKDSWWDNQWATPAAFLDWLSIVVDVFARILKPNGSLYLFASPKMAARVEVLTSERLNVLNRIRWMKEHGWHQKAEKEAIRSYLSPWEEIIFAEHYGSDGVAMNGAGYDQKCDELRGFVFEPLRVYMMAELERTGWNKRDLNEAMGFAPHGMADSRYFGQSQWQLPTEPHYLKMREITGGFRREYEDLRREYEDLRRPFNLTASKQFTDVWEFMPVLPYPDKHECEKPPALLHHIMDVSTRPGAVVFDPFLGSGRSLEVARDMGLTGIGCEVQKIWCRKAAERLSQTNLFHQAA